MSAQRASLERPTCRKKRGRYDCENHESRKLQFTWHSLHDGEGDLVYTYKDLGTKLAIASNSAEEAGWKIACEQK